MNIIILIVLLVISVYFDYRYRKIPNKLTISVILIGLLYWLTENSFSGLVFSISGIVLGFIVFLIPYLAGGMGAGDVKLMAAVGSLLGWKLTLISALLTALSGGIFSLCFIIISKNGKSTWVSVYNMLFASVFRILFSYTGLNVFLKWQFRYKDFIEVKSKQFIPYAIPIAIGTVLAISGWFQGIINF